MVMLSIVMNACISSLVLFKAADLGRQQAAPTQADAARQKHPAPGSRSAFDTDHIFGRQV